MKKKIATLPHAVIIMVLLLSISREAKAQYDALFSHHTRLSTYYNPATVGGEKEWINLTASYHQQWIGIPGAPANFMLSGHTALNFLERYHGVGVTISGQKKGLFLHTELSGSYAFQLPIGKGTLSIGVQGTFVSSTFDGTGVVIPDGEGLTPNDPAIPMTRVGGKTFDTSVGVAYRTRNFSVGIASKHLLQPQLRFNEFHYLYLRRSYSAQVAYSIRPLDTHLSWHPSLFAISDLQSYRIDANLGVAYDDRFFAGVMYRPLNAAGFNLGMKWSSFFVGYAFEMPTSELIGGNWGSHEIVFTYLIPMNRQKNKSARSKSVRLL